MQIRDTSEEGSGRMGVRVLVVGAGVSGSACAAVLAWAGAEVILLNPALDHVCELPFSPELRDTGPGRRRVGKALDGVPGVVREAWETAMLRSTDGQLTLVDRRLLSIRMKRALENVPGLRLRQGLVVSLEVKPERCGPVEAETAFGEKLQADAVVIAVGADVGGLESCLRAVGAELTESCVEVWPAYRVSNGAPEAQQTRMVTLERVKMAGLAAGPEGPPTPYDDEDLWAKKAWMVVREDGESAGAVLPDGVVTGEMAVAPEYLRLGGMETGAESQDVTRGVRCGLGFGVMTRPGYRVRGRTVSNADRTGRLVGRGRAMPVWITGRAAGAQGYLASIEAGAETGREVAGALLGGADRRVDAPV